MTIVQSFILGLVQGVAEFLPISSSGHLVQVEYWLNLPVEQLQAFDIFLHGGTLLALLTYFRRLFWRMLKGIWEYLTGKVSESNQQAVRMFLILIIATLPAAIIGLFFGDLIESYFRTPLVISAMMFISALIFFWAEKLPSQKTKEQVSLGGAIFIGFAQMIALLPGVSRSGTTLSAGLFQGIKRVPAAEFAFLLAVPVTMGAILLTFYQLFSGQMVWPEWNSSLVGFFTALITGLIVIKFLLTFFKKYSLKIFSLYLIVLAIVIYAVFINGHILVIKTAVINFLISFFRDWGYLIVLICAFVESIPLFGVIVPGGTVIILSGVLALETGLGIHWLILFSSMGAIMGDFVGYSIGRKYGEGILTKYGPRIGFQEEYLYVTHRFCHQFGGGALILGRFNNLVRPFIPMVVGSSKMKAIVFWPSNILGGILWSCFSVLVGYFARQSWEVVQGYVGLGGAIIFTVMIIVAGLLIRYEVKKIRAKKRQMREKKRVHEGAL